MAETSEFPVAAGKNQILMFWLALVFAGLSWGITGPLTKLAVSTGNHPIGVAFWSTVIGAVLLTIVLVIKRRKPPLSSRHLVFFLICGLLGTAFPHSLTYAAYEVVSVGVAVIIISLVPMMTFLLALSLGMEKPNLTRIVGLGLGILSVLIITLPESSLPDPSHVWWVVALVLVSLSYAGETIYIALQTPEDCDAFMIMCGLTWGALFLLIPLMFVTDAWFDITRMGVAEISNVVMAVLHVIAYFSYIWLLSNAGPVFAAQAGYIVTGSGVFFGILFFDEHHSVWIWLALVLMLVGLTLVKPKDEQDGHSEV